MSAGEWAALDRLLSSGQDAVPPPSSYGSDAPVKFKGPSPASIGPKYDPSDTSRAKERNAQQQKNHELDQDDDDLVDDGRPEPHYDIIYKQNVSPEDMFLGIDPLRHAGVSCSDAIVLVVRLPGSKLSEINLDVRSNRVKVDSPRWRLRVFLPDKVDEHSGKAQWDSKVEELQISLPMVRELESQLPVSSLGDID